MRKIVKGNTEPGMDMRGYRQTRQGDGWLVFWLVVTVIVTYRLWQYFG